MTKTAMYQGDKAIINTYVLNNRVKNMNLKMTEIKGEIHNSLIIVGNFNNSFNT